MHHTNLLNDIKNMIMEVETFDEAIDITNRVFGNKKEGYDKTISMSVPCFTWESVKINPVAYCDECGDMLCPGTKCLNEYYVYSGRLPVNKYCTNCADTVLRRCAELMNEFQLNKKPLTNM